MELDEVPLNPHDLRSGSMLELSRRKFVDCEVVLWNYAHVCMDISREDGCRAFLILDKIPLAEPNLLSAIEFAKLFIAGNALYKDALNDTLVIEEDTPCIMMRFLEEHRLMVLLRNGTLRLLSFSEEQLIWSHTSWNVHTSPGGYIVEGIYLFKSKKLLWILRDDGSDSLKICNLDISHGVAEMGPSMTLLSAHDRGLSIVEGDLSTGCWVLGIGSSQLWRYAGDVGAMVAATTPGLILCGSSCGDSKLRVTHDQGHSTVAFKRTPRGVYEVVEDSDEEEGAHLQASEVELFAAGLLSEELPSSSSSSSVEEDMRVDTGKKRGERKVEVSSLVGEKGAMVWLKLLDSISLCPPSSAPPTDPELVLDLSIALETSTEAVKPLLIRHYVTRPWMVHGAMAAALQGLGRREGDVEFKRAWEMAATSAVLALVSFSSGDKNRSHLQNGLQEACLRSLLLAGRRQEAVSLLRSWEWDEALGELRDQIDASVRLLESILCGNEREVGVYRACSPPISSVAKVNTIAAALNAQVVGPLERLLQERRGLLSDLM